MIVSTPEGTPVPSTAGQTIGPFFGFGLPYQGGNEVAHPWSPGAIVLSGTIRQGNGDPIPDAMIEIWQADSDGSVPTARGSLHRDGHAFTGFGRTGTTDDGRYLFWTRNPGATEPGKAPFIAVALFSRGLPDKLHTRIYLPDDEAALAADPVLASLTDAERATLIAVRTADGGLQHDIHLQGEKETVFFAY
ncbi:MAG: protocatechuate 3,4-dioxygenase subunit alpha [Microbacteriaceae bacterium]|nr:protocatechuate 3,4-dioxygenase subunit alpha [Microbacteriaceae bacterium]